MKFKKRLLILWITVILAVTYYCACYFSAHSPGIALPYVDGWNQNTSKNVSHYVSEALEPLIMPKNFCMEKGLLLVVVNIRPDNFEARSAIRETWGQKSSKVAFNFLVGEAKNHSHEVHLRLRNESKHYNDVIQERFKDSYNNLTLKSVNMLKLFSRYCSKSYKYLMKIDDDVFLNVQNVLEMLENKTDKDLLVGKLIDETSPIRDPTSKWYVPYELYPEENYPDYLCGPTYVMSADVAEKLYRCALETPIFFIEDVYITGVCAKKINLPPQHNSLFTCHEVKKYVCLHRKRYSVHHFTPEDMRKSHKILTEKRCPPPGSTLEWILSIF